MANSRIFAILVFFRRHAWRFAIALGLFAFIVWLVLSIPRFMTFGSKINQINDKKQNSSSSSSLSETKNFQDSEKNSVAYPVVLIAYRDGVYTDLGFFSEGSKVGDFRLAFYRYSSASLTWEYYNNDVLVSSYSSNWLGVVPKDSSK